ncbi:unnamed protein product [Urochloa humidicola]
MASVQIRVRDAWATAARRKSIHYAISGRDTMAAGITDAARQAYYCYRAKFWLELRNGPDRWHSHRKSGETACTITSTAEVVDPQLAAAIALLGTLNTDLDAASDEIYMLRDQLTKVEEHIEHLEQQQGALAPCSPVYRADSPPRKRVRYGSATARTTVEP